MSLFASNSKIPTLGSAGMFEISSTMDGSTSPAPPARYCARSPLKDVTRDHTHEHAEGSSPSLPGTPMPASFLRLTKSTKHRLSPSPSPTMQNRYGQETSPSGIAIAPLPSGSQPGLLAPPPSNASRLRQWRSMAPISSEAPQPSSSPVEESPTPACGMASAAARLRLVDHEESPIRPSAGASRSLAEGLRKASLGGRGAIAGLGSSGGRLSPCPPGSGSGLFGQPPATPLAGADAAAHENPLLSHSRLPPPPLFPPRQVSSHDLAQNQSRLTTKTLRRDDTKVSRLTKSTNSRPRDTDQGFAARLASSKKALSLGSLNTVVERDETFGSIPVNPGAGRKVSRGSGGLLPGSLAHRRVNSRDGGGIGSMGSLSRSAGQKSGLALNLSPNSLPAFESTSTLSSIATHTLTPPISSALLNGPNFDDIKPLQEVFEQSAPVLTHKYKPSADTRPDEGEPMQADVRNAASGDMRASLARSTKRPAQLDRVALAASASAGFASRQVPETPIAQSHSARTPGGDEAHTAARRQSRADLFTMAGLDVSRMSNSMDEDDGEPVVPGTPVKKHSHTRSLSHQQSRYRPSVMPGSGRMSQSSSHPSLATASDRPIISAPRRMSLASATSGFPLSSSRGAGGSVLPPAFALNKPSATFGGGLGRSTASRMLVDQAGGFADDDDGIEVVDEDPSPTRRLSIGSNAGFAVKEDLTKSRRPGFLRPPTLRRISSDVTDVMMTPTRATGDRAALAPPSEGQSSSSPSEGPSPSPCRFLGSSSRPSHANPAGVPRLSLPTYMSPKLHKTHRHRQSEPVRQADESDEPDYLEERFIPLAQVGKGAFSTVMQVQEKDTGVVWAIKTTRGFFDGVKDRLRHLEEVDILRHLSNPPHENVIRFENAWEQDRKLYIQTELATCSFKYFVDEFGKSNGRLDEGRIWKVIRDLSDGIHHIHSNGVIHFDLKPDNILVAGEGVLKIADFGMASRYPRISPAEILAGAGFDIPENQPLIASLQSSNWTKIDREGDRVYMAPEMLQGHSTMAADVFSFGLMMYELAFHINVPDGGPAWHALRENNFSLVDMSEVSPALTELVTACMASDPVQRPSIEHVKYHQVVQRSRAGTFALLPEAEGFEAFLLGQSSFMTAATEDVEMMEA